MSYHPPQQPYRACLRYLWLGILLLSNSVAFCQELIYYPRAESNTDTRLLYPVALLELCLRHTQYQLQPSTTAMQQVRNLRMLKQGQGLDVMWSVTTKEREAELLPIRIPIDRGLIGWRLFLIHEQRAKRFTSVTSEAELRSLRAGQGHDWPDREILTANFFSVTPSSSYEGLFHMLQRGHIDYFPRSISEIDAELSAHEGMGLRIEPKLALHYPAALYYFVNKDNQPLAQAITTGLEQALADGSLRQLFNQYYGAAIKAANLSSRTIITLPNYLLPAETPLADARYWFTPEEDVQ